jgi:hypothetical protein
MLMFDALWSIETDDGRTRPSERDSKRLAQRIADANEWGTVVSHSWQYTLHRSFELTITCATTPTTRTITQKRTVRVYTADMGNLPPNLWNPDSVPVIVTEDSY